MLCVVIAVWVSLSSDLVSPTPDVQCLSIAELINAIRARRRQEAQEDVDEEPGSPDKSTTDVPPALPHEGLLRIEGDATATAELIAPGHPLSQTHIGMPSQWISIHCLRMKSLLSNPMA